MSDSLLPPNATQAERAIEGATARVGDVPTPARTVWDPATCPADLLPWLAWAFSVDNWETDWTEAQKRSAIAASYAVHRTKGTIGAVRRALNALGLGVQIVEWFEEDPPGDPYTFRVSLNVDQGEVSQESLRKALAVIYAAKNLRSHLANIDVIVESIADVVFAGVSLSGHEITIEPWIPSEAGVLTESGRGILTEDGKLLITE